MIISNFNQAKQIVDVSTFVILKIMTFKISICKD